MFAIADHAGVARIQALDLQQAPDQLALVVEPAIEIGAVDGRQQRREAEVLHHFAGDDGGLGGAEDQLRA